MGRRPRPRHVNVVARDKSAVVAKRIFETETLRRGASQRRLRASLTTGGTRDSDSLDGSVVLPRRGALPRRAARLAGGQPAGSGAGGHRRVGRVRQGVAAPALRGRLVRRALAEGVRRPRRVADRADHLPGGDGARRRAAAHQPRRADHGRAGADRARHRGAEAALPAEASSPPRRSGARASPSPTPAPTSRRCKTRAVLDGDDFVVNGQKVWTSFARYADWCMLLVRTDPDAPKHKGITFLLVDMHSPGITVRPLKQISGDEDFNEVFFEDVRVPRANVGRRGQRRLGHRHHHADARARRRSPSAASCSRASRSTELLAPGAPLAATARRRAQRSAACARSSPRRYIDSEAMKYTALRNLTRVLRGGVPGPEGSVEKLFWSEMYQRMLETALELLGPVRAAAARLAARRRRRPLAASDAVLARPHDRRRLVGDPAQHHRRARARPAAATR